LAFVLRSAVIAIGALLSLLWARLLLDALGNDVFGLLLAFLAITQLGGLGDLGLSGAVGIRILRHLARGETELGKTFLAQARGAFVALSLLFVFGTSAASASLPGILGFGDLPRAGSLTVLFITGGIGIAVMICGGYFNNINYALGNVVWPVVPSFFFSQLTFCGQFLFARSGAPLWVIYLVHVASMAGMLLVTLWMIRVTHPWAGDLRPCVMDLRRTRELARTSVWVYFCSLGSLVYLTTDRLVINGVLGAAELPTYYFNYKLCELAMTFLGSAAYVSLPGILVRLASHDPKERQHGMTGTLRLQRLQVFFGCLAAGAYLVVNNFFISLWLGPAFLVPLSLQIAFALNLAITISGEVGVHLLGRLDESGLRVAGVTIAGTAVLNLCLSLLAAHSGSLLGVAAATLVAQSFASVIMGAATCHRLSLSHPRWTVRTWVLPTLAVGLMAAARVMLEPTSLFSAVALSGAIGLVLVALAGAIGLRFYMFIEEWQRLRVSFRVNAT